MRLQNEFEAVVVDNTITPRLRVRPMYFELGFSDKVEIYARKGVLMRLLAVLEHLPENIGMEIWDVYRSREVQTTLFNWMLGEVKKQHPKFTETEAFEETKKYAALPAKVGEAYCSPHLSGGAVDLTLFDRETGNILDMGTGFDDCSPRAHALYFETHTPAEETIRTSRALLRNAMLSAGFTAYEYEWWHFDYGNQSWAKQMNTSALFGPLFGDNEWPV